MTMPKEFQFTGSLDPMGNSFKYSQIYDVNNPPPISSLFVNDTNEHSGSWQTIQILSASIFAILSGSMSGGSGSLIPTGTQLKGHFTDIKLASGVILLLNESRL